ncbi:MAG: sulfurtransferase complex subunit TusB [Candidatus Thermoplasmatota archaeon]|nr:sulfurtransferase complex subunit TusB [Candidatus Thermoplasmatota archaeon]
MVRTVFLALRSPQEQDPSEMIRRFASREEAYLVLVEDAVYNALDPRRAEGLKEVAHEVYVVKDDLAAKGFSEADLKAGKVTDYEGIVELIMEETERTVTL